MRNHRTLPKIIRHIDTILQYAGNVDYSEFMDNSMMVDACVFDLSQIGELVNKTDREYIERYPEIPWFEIRGLRNRIVHDYEGVNLNLIWEIISSDLPTLKEQLEKIVRRIISC